MTQEDKELLLKDLCARLPYGLKCDKDGEVYDLVSVEIPQGFVRIKKMVNHLPVITTRSILREDVVKPYLRPMSSMTVEEISKIEAIIGNGFKYKDGELMVCSEDVIKLSCSKIHELVEFSYQRHIDVNGLIPMCLALEAPEGMYNLN